MIRKKVKHIYFKSFIDNADIINTHNYFTSYSEFFITENGIGLHETLENGTIEDDDRINFLDAHINAMQKAIKDGANVCGYYVWSTFDLYSWVNGYEKRYGLIYIDFNDERLIRIPKKSYYWYKQLIENTNVRYGEAV